MNGTPPPVAPPAAIPWYKSNVIRGIAVSVIAQILSKTQFASLFTTVDITLYVNDAFDLISAGAAGWAVYSRTKHPTPQVTATQAQATAINAVGAPAIQPVQPPPVKP